MINFYNLCFRRVAVTQKVRAWLKVNVFAEKF